MRFQRLSFSQKNSRFGNIKTNKLHNFAHCGHIITAERLKNGNLIYYDAQSGTPINIDEYSAMNVEYIEIIKVDKLLLRKDWFMAIAQPFDPA